MTNSNSPTTVRLADLEVATLPNGKACEDWRSTIRPRDFSEIPSFFDIHVTEHTSFVADLARYHLGCISPGVTEDKNGETDHSMGDPSAEAQQSNAPHLASYLDRSATFDFASMARKPIGWRKATPPPGRYTDVYSALGTDLQGWLTGTIEVVVVERSRGWRYLPPTVAISLLNVPSTIWTQPQDWRLKGYLNSMFDLDGQLSMDNVTWGERSKNCKLELFQNIKACVKQAYELFFDDAGL